MRVYIIDNYDSFTYNLYQYIGELLSSAQFRGEIDAFDITVKRNDEVRLDEIRSANPDRIIISPGAGSPEDPRYFGVCADVIRKLGPQIPLLGVCLGMQGIVHVFGGRIVKASLPMHGKISAITHNAKGVFHNTPEQLETMRYHSLVAEPKSLPDCLEVTAVVGEISPSELADNSRIVQMDGLEIMGIRHREHPIQGIQFHPESFATEGGKELIRNFLFR